MPRKTFVTGNILTDTDLNDYLMDQSVMTFADSTARSSAIPAPSAGMVTYLTGSTAVEFWNGASWQNINDNTASVPLNTVTTEGDLIVATGNAAVTRLGKGTAGQVLTAGTATLEWANPSADIPLTTVTASGDLIVANGSASVTRLGIGSENQVLTVGTAGIVWQTPASVSKTVEVFTSSTTWVIPDGVNYVSIYLASGGYGGGSGGVQVGANQAGNRNAGGAGGGAGATVYGFTDVKVTPLSTATITVGAGGAGGAGVTITTGSAVGNDGSIGEASSVVLTTGTLSAVVSSGGTGKNGETSTADGAGGSLIFDSAQMPTYMSTGDGGTGQGPGSTGSDSQLLPANERYLFTVAPLLGGTATAATGATLAGTAGLPVQAGFAGGGGGGGGARYSTLASAVFGGGDGRYGGGAGASGNYALQGGAALVGEAGGNGAANSGGGGGGGGGAGMPNGTATSGAGGNGGSGFVVVTY